MIYSLLTTLLRKHFFVVHHEKLHNEGGSFYLERFVAKDPMLRPELIVINDQPHGFKNPEAENLSLEDFPIYIELEYSIGEHGEHLVESLDLYAETNHQCKQSLSEVIYLANIFQQTVTFDRIRRVNNPSQESLLIYSRINDLFQDAYLEDDLILGDLTDTGEFEILFETYLTSFTTFIKLVHDVLVLGHSVDKITKLSNPKPEL